MDGVLIIDKPSGWTSHDVVNFIRRRFDVKKVGHAGTLDPMATGVLVMLIGKYTKASSRFMSADKEYYAEMKLGGTSDTGDAWGKVVASGVTVDIKEDKIREVFKGFLGSIEQVPPIYSAVKHKGKKLYELARKGISVKVEPRTIFIEKLDITKIELPEVAFKVCCSKGTYIRQLCVDIGSRLGCGAYLSKLERTRSGAFHIENAMSIEELKAGTAQDLEKRLITETDSN
ncbi:MAG: tRNA pseudouridine(55) synthase TruB [Candidatus Omnitrophota bacterium]|jgi:tRNA pseudouridine55 synthase